jgi:hypothetical protein
MSVAIHSAAIPICQRSAPTGFAALCWAHRGEFITSEDYQKLR